MAKPKEVLTDEQMDEMVKPKMSEKDEELEEAETEEEEPEEDKPTDDGDEED
jgi:hypothetical protein